MGTICSTCWNAIKYCITCQCFNCNCLYSKEENCPRCGLCGKCCKCENKLDKNTQNEPELEINMDSHPNEKDFSHENKGYYNAKRSLLDNEVKHIELKNMKTCKDNSNNNNDLIDNDKNEKFLTLKVEKKNQKENSQLERKLKKSIRLTEEKNTFDKETNYLAHQNNEIEKIKQDLEDKKRQLNKEKAKLDEDKAKLNEERKELIKNFEGKEKLFQKNKEKYDNMKNELDKKEKELEQLNIEKKELKEKNDNFIIELEKKEKSLKELDESISKQKQELSEKNFEFIQRDEQLKQKEKEISDISLEINQKQKEIIEEENKLQAKENSLNNLQNSLQNEKNILENEKYILEQDKQNLINEKTPNEIGLQNIGATCYMNATLQSLSNTDKFTEYFLNIYQFDPNNTSKKMSNEMYKVLFNLWSKTKKKGDYAPNDFKIALSEENNLFAGVQANDSKDLINFLLERFHQEMNNPSPNNNNNINNNANQLDEMQTLNAFVNEYFSENKSIITDCFYGLLETKSKCSGCNVVKYNFQIYSFLEFPLEDINKYMFYNGRRAALFKPDGSGPDVDLYECFDYHQKVDIMNGQNQMYCNFCNGNRDSYYGSSIYSLPNYLIVILHRGKGAVYKCNVKFYETLNLLNYVTYKSGNTCMKLYAVICHFGESSMSGHFVAFCKHRKTNKWYCYNDCFVTECKDQQEFYKGMPYILFYKAV